MTSHTHTHIEPPPLPPNDSGTPIKTKLNGASPLLKNPCMDATHLCSLLLPQLFLKTIPIHIFSIENPDLII